MKKIKNAYVVPSAELISLSSSESILENSLETVCDPSEDDRFAPLT